MDHPPSYEISYGKARVPLYRVFATPQQGLKPIPESSFTGRNNNLFAVEIDVEVLGNNFLPAYLSGDNSNVVATDSMKNFILRKALEFKGATLEAFLEFLGREFLATYPQMEELRLTGRELPFRAARVPGAGGFEESELLYSRTGEDYALATLSFKRSENGGAASGHRCGRVGLLLMKLSGSAFTRFVRDNFTTLEERVDRPLFIQLDFYWHYSRTADMLNPDLANYISPEQVRDLVQVVFHEFVSESIQHLVHEMGRRLLARFPQMSEVSFEAQNLTKDLIAASETDPRQKVYSEPFPAQGLIRLKVTR